MSDKNSRKREEIQRAAYRCFRDTGYHGTSVDQICEAAGISKGSFYWHYPSKHDVFVELLETWTRQIMDELYDQFKQSVLHQDYVTAVTEALKKEIHRGRALVPLWLEFTLLAHRSAEFQDVLPRFYRRARLAIAEVLRPITVGRMTEDELDGVAAAIFGAYTGLMMQEISDPTGAHADEAMAQCVAVLGRYLRTPPRA